VDRQSTSRASGFQGLEKKMNVLKQTNGNFVKAELKNGKLRAKVTAGLCAVGDTISLKRYDTQTHEYIVESFRVTGLGATWTDRGYIIDEEDSRSFGGQGERTVVQGQGQVHYAYLEIVA